VTTRSSAPGPEPAWGSHVPGSGGGKRCGSGRPRQAKRRSPRWFTVRPARAASRVLAPTERRSIERCTVRPTLAHQHVPIGGYMRVLVRSVPAFVRARPVLVVVIASVVFHLLVVLVVRFAGDGVLFLDDAGYLRLAEERAAGQSGAWDAYERWLFLHAWLLLGPVSALFAALGPDPILGQLWVAAWGVAAAAAVATLLARRFGPAPALVGGAFVGLTPSHVMWSSLVLKDGIVWALLASLLGCIALVLRSDAPGRKLAWCTATAVVLAALFLIRPHSLAIAAIAIALTAVMSVRVNRLAGTAGLLTVAVMVPLALGMGPLASDYVSRKAGTVEDVRAGNAVDAETAFRDQPTAATGAGAGDGDGDDGGATRPEPTEEGGIRAALTGLRFVVLEPGPWLAGEGRDHLAAQLETVLVWYPLLLLASLGAVEVVRRRRADFLAAALLAVGILGAYALTESNLGTSYRHRAEAAPALALLAGLAVARLVGSDEPSADDEHADVEAAEGDPVAR
jgi:hypothetical protein